MAKPRVALWWAGSCGGCDVAVLDTSERLLDLAKAADIVFWPFTLDFKYHDVEAMQDGSIDLCLVNGAIRSSEQARVARLLRAKSKAMVAFGACACFGGIPALGNLTSRNEVFQRVYVAAPSNANPDGVLPQTLVRVPEGELDLPEFSDTVSSLDQQVKVDYFVPGCPPPADLIIKTVNDFAAGKLSAMNAMAVSDKTLCDECERTKEGGKTTRIYRPHEIIPDPKKCLLEQGIICCGPATRSGCGLSCIKANMPCRGCFGPPPGIIDQGAKMLSALVSVYEAHEEDEISRLLGEMVDPAGTFYRFGMARSLLHRKRLMPVEVSGK